MEESDIKAILQLILKNIKNKDFIWRLEGSANLRIQGIDVSVNDLDITTDKKGIEIFREALKEFIIKDFFNPKVKGTSLVCNINDFEVEINCYGDKELKMFDKIKKIIWQDLEIPILPLEYAKQFYELINRKEKVELIKRYL